MAPLALIGSNAEAQNSAAIKQTPLTKDEYRREIVKSTMFICLERENGVEFDKASKASITASVYTIQLFNGSQFAFGNIKDKLKPERIAKIVQTDIFLRAHALCPKMLPDDINKQAVTIKEKIKEKIKSQKK